MPTNWSLVAKLTLTRVLVVVAASSCGQVRAVTGDAAGSGSPVLDAMIDGPAIDQARTILSDDFSMPLDPTRWHTSFNSGANVYVAPGTGTLVLETIPNTECGSAEANGVDQAAITKSTTLTFETVVAAYHDQSIYGDHQPRGLRSGSDANNVLEFVSANPVPNSVTCRSSQGGVATETTVDIGISISDLNTYRIEATASGVAFSVNGNLVCMHTANIPIGIPLNPFFSTTDGCAGNVPVTVDRVEFDVK